MKKKKYNQIFYAVFSATSFLFLVGYSMRLHRDGIPVLICLILHTSFMLLLYKDTLLQEPSEETDTPLPLAEETESLDPMAQIYLKTISTEVKEQLVEAPANKAIASFAEAEPAEEISSASVTETETEKITDSAPQRAFPLAPAANPTAELDLVAAAREALDSLSVFAKKKNIQIHLSSVCETLMIHADPDSIRILFRNIIDNSIKYMGQAGHMMITISLLGNDIFIILKDTGKGLPAEETIHIFELNFQGSNRVSGNGLGLTQAKQIVESLGGTIYAKSNINNGMAIYIQLPVIKVSQTV